MAEKFKMISLVLSMVTFFNFATALILGGESGTLESNSAVGEILKEDFLLDRVHDLESEVALMREEKQRMFTLLKELDIDFDLATEEVLEDADNILNSAEQIQSQPEINGDFIHVNTELFEAEITRFPQEITRLLRSRRAAVNGQVAFTAYLNSTIPSTAIGQVIGFNKVLLNEGQGFNVSTGEFTAPVTGTYLFSFFFNTLNQTSFLRLVVNGANQIDAVANTHTNVTGRPLNSMGGNTAITYVNMGDIVRVESYEVDGAKVSSTEKFRVTTFSGVLLY